MTKTPHRRRTSTVHWYSLDGASVHLTQNILLWANPSPQPKPHLDRFSHFAQRTAECRRACQPGTSFPRKTAPSHVERFDQHAIPPLHASCDKKTANFSTSREGNWTTRGYANSRIVISRTGHLADWSTRGLDNSRMSPVVVVLSR